MFFEYTLRHYFMQKSWKAAQGSRKHQSKPCQKDLFFSQGISKSYKYILTLFLLSIGLKTLVLSALVLLKWGRSAFENYWHTKFPKNKYLKKKLYSTKRKYHFSVQPRQNKKKCNKKLKASRHSNFCESTCTHSILKQFLLKYYVCT